LRPTGPGTPKPRPGPDPLDHSPLSLSSSSPSSSYPLGFRPPPGSSGRRPPPASTQVPARLHHGRSHPGLPRRPSFKMPAAPRCLASAVRSAAPSPSALPVVILKPPPSFLRQSGARVGEQHLFWPQVLCILYVQVAPTTLVRQQELQCVVLRHTVIQETKISGPVSDFSIS
jgi:hypothetical protein